MKLITWPKLRVYSFLLSMPFIVAMLHLIMFEDRVWREPKIWLLSTPLIYFLGTFSMQGHMMYDMMLERKFPALNQTKQRVLGKMCVTVFVMTPSVYLIFFIYHQFHILGYVFHARHLWQGALVGLGVNVIFETLYEGEYIFSKYKELSSENDTLHEVAAQQEFDALKGQVNPHFLFNCFNTLSSLITVDKQNALQFLDELSKVYRYLLQNNQETLSTLQQELTFIDSYFKLLKTRHGSSIQIRQNIGRQYYSYYLPSLTLQLVIENAVKHNAMSKTQPLSIDIFTAGENKLIVTNNLQRRATPVPSTGIGLKNIQMKYRLLQQPGFQVLEGGNNFSIVLPLIWNPHGAVGKS
jgi:two-component system, LytTR family, sensor kinase